jgi:PGF-CTERM protein
MRRALTTVAVVVLVLASLAPAVTAAPPSASVSTVGSERVTDAPVSSTTMTDTSASNNTTDAPPDPESDQLGWEDGYWYNESLDVDQDDGLSQSELNATVARAMARVELIRGLEFEQTVPVEIISRDAFANASSGGEVNETFRAFDDTKFEALLLVGEEDDSLDVQQQNRGSSVLGYYSPSQDRIVIVSENASSPKIDEFTLAHELVHALQDQHFDLASIRAQTRDGSNANAGIVEGDASFVEQRYDRRCGEGGAWNGTCIRPPREDGSGGGGSGPANLGVYFLKFQPYSDGPAFVAEQYREGGWEAVNAVYENLPASAEQVIHPEKYGEDAPTDVTLQDRNSGDWERLRPPNRLDYATVGQAGVASMFVYPLYNEGRSGGRIVQPQNWLNYTDDGSVSSFDPLKYDFDYAAGWDGDRMHFYRNADGETAYVWRLVWDSPGEATEFRDGYVQVLQYWGAQEVSDRTYRIPEGESEFADAFHVRVSGDTVTIVNAPTVDGLAEVRSSVTVQTETETATATEPDPGTDTAASATTTGAEAPGFSAITALVALLATVLLVRRR